MEWKLVINPGDLIIGDTNSVVAVPNSLTVPILKQVGRILGNENNSRKAIAGGQDPLAVYKVYATF